MPLERYKKWTAKTLCFVFEKSFDYVTFKSID